MIRFLPAVASARPAAAFAVALAAVAVLASPPALAAGGSFPSLETVRELARSEGVPGCAVVLVREGHPDVL
ncbi:MAG: hypothetical protein ACYTJ0_13410, partial [Planctomycetota bacterium]